MENNSNLISIIKIIIFVVIFLLLCIVLNYFSKPKLYDIGITSGFYSEKKNSLDVVYIGGSACFVYYEPLMAYEKYGITSYDFGTNTIQPELYSYMIKEILKRQDPKVIVIDARAFQYRDVDQPPTEVAYRNLLTGMPLNINKVSFVENNVRKKLNVYNTLSYYFDFIKFHSATDRYTSVEGIRMLLNKYKNKYKGFMFIPKVEKQEFKNYETEKKVSMSKETVKILDDLLKYLNTTDHEYLFIVSPYIEQKKHKENFNYIRDKIDEAGFQFIDANDYREDMNIDYDTDFYNYNHVNIFGADKYTDFLSKYLKENYNLEDRRKEKKYNKWKELLKSWNTEKKNTKSEINKLIKISKLEESKEE